MNLPRIHLNPKLYPLIALVGGVGVGFIIYLIIRGQQEVSPELAAENGSDTMTDPLRDAPPTAFPYVRIAPNKYLRADAGRAYLAMAAAAKKDGIDLPVSTAYRNLIWQTKLWNAWLAYKAGTGPWAPLAAKPDANAPHVRGLALDLHGFDKAKANYSPQRDAWMQKNAARFGWHQTGLTFSVKEPWHWYFKGSPEYPVDSTLPQQPAQLVA